MKRLALIVLFVLIALSPLGERGRVVRRMHMATSDNAVLELYGNYAAFATAMAGKEATP